MNRIYFVRHGENVANLTHEFSSRNVDYSLTSKGRLQAQQTAEFFRDKNIHEIYASPLKRARETAEVIGSRLGLSVTMMDSFRELNVGELEGKPVSAELWDLHDEIVRGWFTGRPERSFPGGDNYFDLWQRMQAGLKTVLAGKDGRNIVIVGHGGLFNFTIGEICPGIDVRSYARNAHPNCGVSELLFATSNSHWEAEIVSWAQCAHLTGDAALLVPGRP